MFKAIYRSGEISIKAKLIFKEENKWKKALKSRKGFTSPAKQKK